MALGASIGSRISDLIGDTYSTIPSLSYKDLINAAFNEVVDLCNPKELLKYSRTPGILESNSEWLVKDRKILEVRRIDADSNGVERTCIKTDRDGFAVAQDSGSIYKATNHSPVYHEDHDNAGAATLKIIPEPTGSQKGKIWYFNYAGDTTDLVARDADYLRDTLNMPPTIIHAIVLKSCLNILNGYISEQVQEEEDVELMQMVQNQIQILEKNFLQEMQRFSNKTSPVEAE